MKDIEKCLLCELKTRSQSYQTFFFLFAIKLGCFKAKGLFSYVTNTQALQGKSENKEKTSLVGLTPEYVFSADEKEEK